jgi:hypothetical protein
MSLNKLQYNKILLNITHSNLQPDKWNNHNVKNIGEAKAVLKLNFTD